MKEIFVDDSSKRLRYSAGKLIVRDQDGSKELEIAINQIDSLNIIGNPQISTQLLKAMSVRKKSVHFYSNNGKYISSLYTSYEENYEKQWAQFEAINNPDFKIKMARKIVQNKIALQAGLISAYNTDKIVDSEEIGQFRKYYEAAGETRAMNNILGYEGKTAKNYFYYLGMMVPSEFKFYGRSKRPPKDPFNAMISFGYGILYGYLRGALTKYGLNLGFGLLHANRSHHAALVSDLMEVWRPIIVDDVVMNLLTEQRISFDMFDIKKNEAVYLTPEGRKIFLSALRDRMSQKHDYFNHTQKRFYFIYTVNQQVESLLRAYSEQNPDLYHWIGVDENAKII